MSEPECLIEYMDRHEDYAVIICLVGWGQEIHDGEAGIGEWFSAIKRSFPHWRVYCSDKMAGDEYVGKEAIIDGDAKLARELYLKISERDEITGSARYPIVMTRDLAAAKEWVSAQSRGTERYGLIASSGAKRLRADGIDVSADIKVEKWFLKGKDDVNSSYFMELAATEFQIQGLEIDWAVVAWEADHRYTDDGFRYFVFSGSSWKNIRSDQEMRYLKNAYRVLLTRARQGLAIYVPRGGKDATRDPSFYDPTFDYLKSIGIVEI